MASHNFLGYFAAALALPPSRLICLCFPSHFLLTSFAISMQFVTHLVLFRATPSIFPFLVTATCPYMHWSPVTTLTLGSAINSTISFIFQDLAPSGCSCTNILPSSNCFQYCSIAHFICDSPSFSFSSLAFVHLFIVCSLLKGVHSGLPINSFGFLSSNISSASFLFLPSLRSHPVFKSSASPTFNPHFSPSFVILGSLYISIMSTCPFSCILFNVVLAFFPSTSVSPFISMSCSSS